MAVYRIEIEKGSTQNPSFKNRYYLNTVSLASALTLGAALAAYEKGIFGETVNFLNVHADELGTLTFGNAPLSGTGAIAASLPVKSFIVARVVWAVEGTYPYYKNYRVQVASGSITGTVWGSAMQTDLGLFTTAINEDFDGLLCTKDGDPLGAATASTQYFNQQESKKWYNRDV